MNSVMETVPKICHFTSEAHMDMKVVPVPCHIIFETSLPVGNCIFILPYAQGFLRKKIVKGK